MCDHLRKASGNLKILHTAHKDDDGVYAATFYEAVKQTPALEALVNKVEEDLNPERVLQLFRCMSDEDCLLLDLPGRPEHLLLQVVPVAPVCIRPSVEMDSMGSNEDDVTMKLMVTMAAAVIGIVFVCCSDGIRICVLPLYEFAASICCVNALCLRLVHPPTHSKSPRSTTS